MLEQTGLLFATLFEQWDPVLRLHGIPSTAMDGPWQFHPWPGLETKSPESSKQLTEAPFFEILNQRKIKTLQCPSQAPSPGGRQKKYNQHRKHKKIRKDHATREFDGPNWNTVDTGRATNEQVQ